jgi:hypothetical protein
MAAAHVERLRRLVVCPVCRNPDQPSEEINLYMNFAKRFACGASFVAMDGCDVGITVNHACRSRTELSVQFMNEECAGGCSMTGPVQLLDPDSITLTARRCRLEQVAELFQGGNKSTFEIDAELEISEEEVCGLLADVLRGGW